MPSVKHPKEDELKLPTLEDIEKFTMWAWRNCEKLKDQTDSVEAKRAWSVYNEAQKHLKQLSQTEPSIGKPSANDESEDANDGKQIGIPFPKQA